MQANADMAELADASALGADVFDVGVQIPLSAPNKNKTNPRENLEFVLFFTRDYLDFRYFVFTLNFYCAIIIENRILRGKTL